MTVNIWVSYSLGGWTKVWCENKTVILRFSWFVPNSA